MTFEELGREIGALVQAKNEAYGDSANKSAVILEALYPDGVVVSDYRDLLLVTRIIDKLSRIANGNQGEEDSWEDLMGYSLLGAMRNRK